MPPDSTQALTLRDSRELPARAGWSAPVRPQVAGARSAVHAGTAAGQRPARLPVPGSSAAGRVRRVFILIAAIWTLNLADLGFTLIEARVPHGFIEMNPIAARLLHGPPHGLVLYKLALLTGGSAILWTHRRQRLAELACWFLLAAFSWVAVRWFLYYAHLVESLSDPAVILP